MNKQIFPVSVKIFLSVFTLVLVVAIGGLVYFVYNPSDASIPGRFVKKFMDRKVKTVVHSIYLRILQDPDKDKDGLTDIAEIEIYKTDPTKFNSNGTKVGDGEYIYGIYKKAFESDNEDYILGFQDNLNSYRALRSISTSTNHFLGTGSLNDAFTYRSLQTYNLYVGMTDDTIQTVKQALAFRFQKDYQKSVELLETALSKDPNSSILKYHLGLSYFGMKEYDQALSIYKSIENDPVVKSPLLYSDIASANLALDNDAEFVRYMELSIKKFPEDLEQYLTLASYYQDKNQLDKAEEVLNKGLKIEPRYASFYNALAIIAVFRNDTKMEFELYRKALSYDFRFAPSHLNLSIIYDQKYNDLKNALTEAKIAMEIEPSARRISHLIYIYNKLGQHSKSKALETDLLKMPDIDGSSYNDLGLVYLNKQDYIQAEIYFKKAIALEPRLSNAYNNLGIVLTSTGRESEAFVNYKKAIEINPNYANAHNNLGANYINTEQYKEAQTILEKAIQLDPYNYRPYQNLGKLYELTNNREKMIYYYKKAFEVGSRESVVLDFLKTLER